MMPPRASAGFRVLPPRLDAARGAAGERLPAIADLGGALLAPGRRDLRQQCRDMLIDLLALGVDPNRTVCYCRSDVPQLAELLWIIGCSEAGALIGHSWQDDARFMATDVLGLRATLVAVGADGGDAIAEIRSVAARFNQGFSSEIFPLPARAPDADGEPADADTLER